jgi:hypothetical protein
MDHSNQILRSNIPTCFLNQHKKHIPEIQLIVLNNTNIYFSLNLNKMQISGLFVTTTRVWAATFLFGVIQSTKWISEWQSLQNSQPFIGTNCPFYRLYRPKKKPDRLATTGHQDSKNKKNNFYIFFTKT